MIKKITAACGAVVLALSLSACGGAPVAPLPTLSMPEASAASGTASAASGAASPAPVEKVKESSVEDSLKGLCDYLVGNYAVTGNPEEMSYKEIGAIGGFRYKFTYNGGQVQAEFYEFDLENADEKGQSCLNMVKEKGFFMMLDKEVPATLSQNGKYLMVYNDSKKEDKNKEHQEMVTKLFTEFKK